MAKKGKKIIKVKDNTDTPKKKVLVKTKSVASKASSSVVNNTNKTLAFGKENYKWMGIGLAFITLGMILMLGGYNEDPNVFDEGVIYSFRRITLAPVVILTGLAIQVYAIFR